MQALNIEPSKLIPLLESVANLSPNPKEVSQAVTLWHTLQLQNGTSRRLAWLMPAAA